MLHSGKKFGATKKINILTLVLSEKIFLNETKNHNPPPPFKLNGRSIRFSENIVSKINVQIIKRKYIMTNIDTQETDYSVYCQSRKR